MGSGPCDVPGVTGCPGGHWKFDDCLAEALYEWSLDGGDGTTGNTDFDGHYALIIVPEATTSTIDPDGENRTVPVPAGNYIVWTASSGAVSLWTYDTEEAARKEFDAAEARYGLWEAGCDVNNPAAHEECGEYDDCQVPWQ